jgi:hypothetical protein
MAKKKKSNHGGARQGAGSLPRLDKVGNVLRLSPVVVTRDDNAEHDVCTARLSRWWRRAAVTRS